MRMNHMISRKEESKADFRYLKEPQARKIMSAFVKNVKLLDDLVKFVEDESLTGF